MKDSHEFVVIGAGLTGLTVSRALSDAGRDVAVLDKGRGIGGRMAHRRIGGAVFDHGSPWVEPGKGRFAEYAACASGEGAAARVDQAPARIVGMPSMTGLLGPLARGLNISQGAEVSRAERRGDGWSLTLGDGGLTARHLVSAVPAPQAARLLPEIAGHIGDVTMTPCWTLMASFAEPLGAPQPEWCDNGARVIREPGKPGRPERPEAWTMHAPAGWSEDNLERDREEIVRDLLRMLSRALQRRLPEPVESKAHRWRYARTGRPLGKPFVKAEGLHAGGDWCLGPAAEDAHSSGLAIAEDILG